MTPDALINDDIEHRLIGREVVHVEDGRRGTVGSVLVYISKITGCRMRTVARMRPAGGSGREWTAADPSTLQPVRPIATGAAA